MTARKVNKIYTAAELSEVLGIELEHLRKMLMSGEIKAYKQGKVWRIPDYSVDDYVELKMKEHEEKQK